MVYPPEGGHHKVVYPPEGGHHKVVYPPEGGHHKVDRLKADTKSLR